MIRKIVSAAVLFVLPSMVFAHPAKDISAELNSQTNVLRITTMHEVKDASKHYIDKISVELNGEEIIMQKMISQPDKGFQKSMFVLADVYPTSKITIKTNCNMTGSFKKEFVIKDIKK